MNREEERNLHFTCVNICERAEKLGVEHVSRMDLVMILKDAAKYYHYSAADMKELVNTTDETFIHDIVGLQKNHPVDEENADWNTFLPRFHS